LAANASRTVTAVAGSNLMHIFEKSSGGVIRVEGLARQTCFDFL
jgi:hypothetical protein